MKVKLSRCRDVSGLWNVRIGVFAVDFARSRG